jgi:hypothetical protein
LFKCRSEAHLLFGDRCGEAGDLLAVSSSFSIIPPLIQIERSRAANIDAAFSAGEWGATAALTPPQNEPRAKHLRRCSDAISEGRAGQPRARRDTSARQTFSQQRVRPSLQSLPPLVKQVDTIRGLGSTSPLFFCPTNQASLSLFNGLAIPLFPTNQLRRLDSLKETLLGVSVGLLTGQLVLKL